MDGPMHGDIEGMLRRRYPGDPVVCPMVVDSIERKIVELIEGYRIAFGYDRRCAPFNHWTYAVGRYGSLKRQGEVVHVGIISHIHFDSEARAWACFDAGKVVQLHEDSTWEEQVP